MEAFGHVDEFLTQRYGVGLEEVLCEGCLMGRVGSGAGEATKVIPRLIRSQREEDGGEACEFEGVLILQGVWYRFSCHLFRDRGGLSFLSDISQFEAIEWQLKLAVG